MEVVTTKKLVLVAGRSHPELSSEVAAQLKLPLADIERGACFDGLQPDGVNQNQGAESTLAYLWTELHSFAAQRALHARTKGDAADAN